MRAILALAVLAVPLAASADVTVVADNPIPGGALADLEHAVRVDRKTFSVVYASSGVQLNAVITAVNDTEILYNCDGAGNTDCYIMAWNIGSPPPVGDSLITFQTPVTRAAVRVRACPLAGTTFSATAGGSSNLAATSCP